MQIFDVALKSLLRHSTVHLIGSPVVNWLDTQLPRVRNLQVDLLGETASGDLVQIEVQTANDPEMPLRMLRYFAVIVDVHDRIPDQVVIYVGRDRLRMQSRYAWRNGELRYSILDIRQIDAEPLLASPEPSDNVLAILARLQDERAAIRRILDKVVTLPPDARREYGEALLILAELRGLEEAVREEDNHMDLTEISRNKVLGPIYSRGWTEAREQGREEGREEGQLALIRRLIQRRFGNLPQEFESRLLQCSGPQLEQLGERVLDASTLDELFD